MLKSSAPAPSTGTMPCKIPSSPSSLLISLVFLLSLFISIIAYPVNTPPTSSCPSSSCGEIDITYPFWVTSNPPSSSYCGYEKFMLKCIDDHPILSIGSYDYTVTKIDYQNQTISLADTDVLKAASCATPGHNLTLKENLLLNYTSIDINLTFLLDCSSGGPEQHKVTCFPRSSKLSYIFLSYDLSTIPVDDWPQNCQQIVVVPVLYEEVYRYYPNNWSAFISEFGNVLKTGFQLSWHNETLAQCPCCESSGGRCGCNQTGNFTCFFSEGMRNPSCGHDNSKRKIIIEIFAALGLSLGCLFLLLYLLRYRKSKSHSKNAQIVEDFLCKYGSIVPKRYKYSEIKKMTNSFGHKIGQGGYGSVFKGNLNDGHPVAVKVLNESKGNGEEFVNEVASISRTSHVNIVCLLGFCLERSKRALIYEFMPNGSLEKFIYGEIPNANIKLDWKKLYEIAVGIAQGLEYLHRGCNTRMVHFDIKPHNILLDQDFCPKISDFGLAKLYPPKESIISMVGARGTIGYIAPEVYLRNFGVVSSKSDVYSYGMMVLEMVGGRKNIDASVENTSEIYFPHWIYDHLDQYDALEAYGVTNETEEIAKRMILVGLWCIQMSPADRPSMSKVLEMLEGKVSNLQIPPKP